MSDYIVRATAANSTDPCICGCYNRYGGDSEKES